MVLHSGNHEIIGVRHRETQTLFISHVIEPHRCSDPAYGKIHVGLYMAAIRETIDRERQKEAKRARDPPSPSVDISPRNDEANLNEDLDGGNAKRHASGKEIDDQVLYRLASPSHKLLMKTSQALLANAAKQNQLCLRFFYDIYDSPHPATFRRLLLDGPKKAPGPTKPRTPLLSPQHETMPISTTSPIHITVHGSTGVMHFGTMAINPSGSGPTTTTTEVAVKLAFSEEEKSRLMEEHRVYSHLHSRNVQGIPRDIGLFVDDEPLSGAEGPYALVTSYAGVSLHGRSKDASDSLKQVLVNSVYIYFIDSK